MKRIVILLGVVISCAFFTSGYDLAQTKNKEQTEPDNTNSRTIPSSSKTETIIEGILLKFCEKYQIPGGASLAISRNERLVYAGAVGYADQNRSVKITPEHRMRIASVSKPITSIAMMKLLEEKKLRLDDFVFGENGVFENKFGMPTYRGKPVDITIRQLLEHNSGGWGRSVNYSSLGIRLQEIEKVLASLPLENAPGTHYDYSNFGYYVLGRIIEVKSGLPYEHYVKETILKPSGIDGMRIGSTRSASDEVYYFAAADRDVNPLTYNNPARIDSFGGWVASPTELLKILVHVDGFPKVKDILDSETLKTMTTRSKTDDHYALGWSLNQSGNNWYHTGSMPGTSSFMARSANGFNWVILINYQTPASTKQEFTRDLDDLFWQIHKTIKEWSTGTEL